MVRIDHLSLFKLKYMNLSLKELNDLCYCVGKVIMMKDKLISDEVLEELSDKLIEEIVKIKVGGRN